VGAEVGRAFAQRLRHYRPNPAGCCISIARIEGRDAIIAEQLPDKKNTLRSTS
jgi:hypothetical protein